MTIVPTKCSRLRLTYDLADDEILARLLALNLGRATGQGEE